MKKWEIPEVGWVAESEIHAKIRNPIQKSGIHSKEQLAGARAKRMKNLLPKQLKFNEMSYLRCYSGRPTNSGRQMMHGIEKFEGIPKTVTLKGWRPSLKDS